MSEPTPCPHKRRKRRWDGIVCRDCGEELIGCWCGAVGTYEELYDDDGLEASCGGTGTLTCRCGGDICVCHHHGHTECPGCEDCEADEVEDYDDRIDDYEPEWGTPGGEG